jgi:hypothetical protein
MANAERIWALCLPIRPDAVTDPWNAAAENCWSRLVDSVAKSRVTSAEVEGWGSYEECALSLFSREPDLYRACVSVKGFAQSVPLEKMLRAVRSTAFVYDSIELPAAVPARGS